MIVGVPARPAVPTSGSEGCGTSVLASPGQTPLQPLCFIITVGTRLSETLYWAIQQQIVTTLLQQKLIKNATNKLFTSSKDWRMKERQNESDYNDKKCVTNLRGNEGTQQLLKHNP